MVEMLFQNPFKVFCALPTPQATLQAADGTQSFSYGKQIFSSLNFNKGSNLTVRECISSERILYRYYINRYVYNIYI